MLRTAMSRIPTSQDSRIGRYTGRIAARFATAGVLAQIERLDELLAVPAGVVAGAGRHRSVRLTLSSENGALDVVVKSFARQPALKDWLDRRRGSKARRAWDAGTHLARHGVGTPAPVGFLERWERSRLAESHYLAVYQDGVTTLRDELIRLFREDPECERFIQLLQRVADAVRAMHDSGFLHNDLGNQNILVRRSGRDDWSDVQFVDLNRSRFGRSLTLRERARDVSRICLPSDLLRVFKEMCFAPARVPRSFRRWERFYRRLYALHCRTRPYRHPVRELRRRRRPPSATASDYPPEKDMWVWDERSGQPVNVMTHRDRRRHHAPLDHARACAATARSLLGVRREYRALLRSAFGSPVEMGRRIGVAVSGYPDRLDGEMALLDALGPVPALLRCCHHRGPASWEQTARAAAALSARGHPVAVAIVQDRRCVLDPRRWQAFVGDVLAQVAPVADWVELGHAVNRVKWGIWTLAEYRRLIAAAAEVATGFPGLRCMGPAAVDFEVSGLMGALDQTPPGFRFQALAQHLYVDRRGAPENRQGGFGALEKFALARAIARRSPACEDRLIVSEVNWPLEGMGVHSPVGAPYVSTEPRRKDPSVSEDDYADYLLRYLLLGICSGLVERVYWWQLVARGFGLVDDTAAGAWRERPAYGALRQFLQTVGAGRFLGLDAPCGVGWGGATVRWFRFQRADGEVVRVAYATEPAEVRLPFACERVTDAFGRTLAERPATVRPGGRPVYFRGCRGMGE